ncbi:hypothetical protein [Lactococcus taiwanensis]|uniref:hypothetical protein n=1 Tax=Lactococcus taiwanensis TaxID=1151742 RepID=UPI001962B628|nr:hypothetical protein [Lactococcus taiwanensis]QRZ10206.1 hypothetical protein JVB21_05135 [Lactococcus taiwanensis]
MNSVIETNKQYHPFAGLIIGAIFGPLVYLFYTKQRIKGSIILFMMLFSGNSSQFSYMLNPLKFFTYDLPYLNNQPYNFGTMQLFMQQYMLWFVILFLISFDSFLLTNSYSQNFEIGRFETLGIFRIRGNQTKSDKKTLAILLCLIISLVSPLLFMPLLNILRWGIMIPIIIIALFIMKPRSMSIPEISAFNTERKEKLKTVRNKALLNAQNSLKDAQYEKSSTKRKNLSDYAKNEQIFAQKSQQDIDKIK